VCVKDNASPCGGGCLSRVWAYRGQDYLPNMRSAGAKEKGLDVLRESQGKMTKKILDKTRQAVLAGIHSEVKNLKYELEERRSKKASK